MKLPDPLRRNEIISLPNRAVGERMVRDHCSFPVGYYERLEALEEEERGFWGSLFDDRDLEE